MRGCPHKSVLSSMVKAVVFDAGETLVNESRQWRMWAEWLKVPDHVLFAALGAIIERGEHHQRVFQLLKPGFDLDAAREERGLVRIALTRPRRFARKH